MNGPDLDEFEGLLAHVKRARGFDFTGYRRTGLLRRAYQRLAILGLGSILAYRRYLEENREELGFLIGALLIHTTGFFREAEAWRGLAARIFTPWATSQNKIRIWCAGCATGPEVWTTAMLLNEVLGGSAYKRRVTVFATDVDEHLLGRVRTARYSEAELSDLPTQYRTRYFERDAAEYVVRTDLRDSVCIARHDLLREPPLPALDLVICRNTMIYFTLDAQMLLLSRLHRTLNKRGYLFLGSTELALTRIPLFKLIDPGARIFARISGARSGCSRPAVKGSAMKQSTTSTVMAYRAKLTRYRTSCDARELV